MKLVFKIKTEPETQATIIIGVVLCHHFCLSGYLAAITIYINFPIAGIIRAAVLAIIVYLVLCLAPH